MVLIRATKRGKKRMKRNKVLRGGFEPLDFASFSLFPSLSLSLTPFLSTHLALSPFLSFAHTHPSGARYTRTRYTHTQDTESTQRARVRTRDLSKNFHSPSFLHTSRPFNFPHSLSLSYACPFPFTQFTIPVRSPLSAHKASLRSFSPSIPFTPSPQSLPLHPSPSHFYAISRWPTTYPSPVPHRATMIPRRGLSDREADDSLQ